MVSLAQKCFAGCLGSEHAGLTFDAEVAIETAMLRNEANDGLGEMDVEVVANDIPPCVGGGAAQTQTNVLQPKRCHQLRCHQLTFPGCCRNFLEAHLLSESPSPQPHPVTLLGPRIFRALRLGPFEGFPDGIARRLAKYANKDHRGCATSRARFHGSMIWNSSIRIALASSDAST